MELVRVLVYESNLLWSSKLRVSLKDLGHDAIILSTRDALPQSGDLAIVNLSQPSPEPEGLISGLQNVGVKVIAHAGHKEKELLELGKKAGADLLVTNGELSVKLGQVIGRLFPPTA